MKNLCLLSLFFFFQSGYASASIKEAPALIEIRNLYEESSTSKDACIKLIGILEAHKNDPLYLGYDGCATMLMAKHVFNPFLKLSYFKKGKEMLENAIKADEKNFELRYLRFTAQTNMPSFLGYHDNIDMDKKFILNSFSQIKDISLKEYALATLKKSKYLTPSEKEELK